LIEEDEKKIFFTYNKPLVESFRIEEFNCEIANLVKIVSIFFELSKTKKEVLKIFFKSFLKIPGEKNCSKFNTFT